MKNKKWLWFFVPVFLVALIWIFQFSVVKTQAYGECDQYGVMVIYDSFTNSCKCMSGYVFGEGLLGDTQCVSANGVCTDKYGYGARYNSASRSCECSYGYVFGEDSIGRTQCVTPDSICSADLGYSARYNILTDNCECGYGDVIDAGKCTSGDLVCRREHGIYSSYKDYENSCKCDDGYTFDDDEKCVKKQNNVYFFLKELDTSQRKAIIQGEYDNDYYLINYGFGCYSISRYLLKDIVINLGTDYGLDTWDKIVLQDDGETCDVTTREKIYPGETLVPEEGPEFDYENVLRDSSIPQNNIFEDDGESTENQLMSSVDPQDAFENTEIKDQFESANDEGWLKRIWKFLWRF